MRREQKSLPNGLLVGHHCEETRPDVIVVAHVLVLLLTPDQLGVGIFLCLYSDQVKREWGDLGGEAKELAEEMKSHSHFAQLTACSDREEGLNTCSSLMIAMSFSSFCCFLSLASS